MAAGAGGPPCRRCPCRRPAPSVPQPPVPAAAGARAAGAGAAGAGAAGAGAGAAGARAAAAAAGAAGWSRRCRCLSRRWCRRGRRCRSRRGHRCAQPPAAAAGITLLGAGPRQQQGQTDQGHDKRGVGALHRGAILRSVDPEGQLSIRIEGGCKSALAQPSRPGRARTRSGRLRRQQARVGVGDREAGIVLVLAELQPQALLRRVRRVRGRPPSARSRRSAAGAVPGPSCSCGRPRAPGWNGK